MKPLRAFFAIKPPQKLMIELMSSLSESPTPLFPKKLIRWIPIEKLHITLQFLKQIQLKDLNALIEQVRQELKDMPPFELKFGGLEWFPTAKHPRILSLEVGPESQLSTLSTAIGQAMSALNYPVESRAFRGHLTLGRLRHFHSQENELLQQIKLAPLPAVPIKEIYFMESKTDKEGTHYYSLAQLALNADDGH